MKRREYLIVFLIMYLLYKILILHWRVFYFKMSTIKLNYFFIYLFISFVFHNFVLVLFLMQRNILKIPPPQNYCSWKQISRGHCSHDQHECGSACVCVCVCAVFSINNNNNDNINNIYCWTQYTHARTPAYICTFIDINVCILQVHFVWVIGLSTRRITMQTKRTTTYVCMYVHMCVEWIHHSDSSINLFHTLALSGWLSHWRSYYTSLHTLHCLGSTSSNIV